MTHLVTSGLLDVEINDKDKEIPLQLYVFIEESYLIVKLPSTSNPNTKVGHNMVEHGIYKSACKDALSCHSDVPL